MKRLAWLFLALLAWPVAARAEQPRCPLPLDSCLVHFDRMHTRPWLGIGIEVDSTGQRLVRQVVPGGPAARAGVKPGDVLEAVDGEDPGRYFLAGKAGWKTGDRLPLRIRRQGRERALALSMERMPEELFARIVGEHMLEGHLAYMDTGVRDRGEVR